MFDDRLAGSCIEVARDCFSQDRRRIRDIMTDDVEAISEFGVSYCQAEFMETAKALMDSLRRASA